MTTAQNQLEKIQQTQWLMLSMIFIVTAGVLAIASYHTEPRVALIVLLAAVLGLFASSITLFRFIAGISPGPHRRAYELIFGEISGGDDA